MSDDPRQSGQRRPIDLARLRRLAVLLDAAVEIPGIRVKVGVDALLGLVPVVGDLLSALFPAYTILHAARHRLPRKVVGRMILNWALDALIGSIPIVGDVFDIGWKANLKNLALLEEHLGATSADEDAEAEIGIDAAPATPELGAQEPPRYGFAP